MVCVKYYNRTKQPFTGSSVLTQDLKHKSNAAVRSLDETRTLPTDYDTMLRTAGNIRDLDYLQAE